MPRAENEIGIVNRKVEDYLAALLPKRDTVLLELEKDARKNSVPIIGPLVGTAISIIARAMEAETALEIGTATGYSGIWIARSLQGQNKKLTTIELNDERIRKANVSFKRAGVSNFVEVVKGNALEIVPKIAKTMPQQFDLVFLDVGDKTLYTDLFESCVDVIRPGGFLVADNTLWGGQVAVKEDKGPEAQVIRKFNRMVFSDVRLIASVIPLRDGFTVALKKRDLLGQ